VPLVGDDQLRHFIESGYLVVPNVVAASEVEALNAEVDRLIAEAPPPAGHVGNHFYWQGPATSPGLFGVLERPRGILQLAQDLVGDDGVDVAFDQAQVALNIPPFDHRPGRPHVDGYRPGQSVPDTFTLLACLLLTDQLSDDGGNLWVWPGTHETHAAFFARRGPQAFAEAAGYPDVELPEPTQVRGRAGDVLLAHYLLGHNIGGNYAGGRTRRALYWRLQAPGHPDRWAECLVDPWAEYPRVKRALATSG
jgi:ectoine hydroxylase-related dioxygenase (phytanoyl-CoA dioxygenase family)